MLKRISSWVNSLRPAQRVFVLAAAAAVAFVLAVALSQPSRGQDLGGCSVANGVEVCTVVNGPCYNLADYDGLHAFAASRGAVLVNFWIIDPARADRAAMVIHRSETNTSEGYLVDYTVGHACLTKLGMPEGAKL